jgi:hypothetical protein
MAGWHIVVFSITDLYSHTMSIMVLDLEKANPPRGGDAKPQASQRWETAGLPEGVVGEAVLL